MKKFVFEMYKLLFTLVISSTLFCMEGPKEISVKSERENYINDIKSADDQSLKSLLELREEKVFDETQNIEIIGKMIDSLKNLIKYNNEERDSNTLEIVNFQTDFAELDPDSDQEVTLLKRIIELHKKINIKIEKDIENHTNELEQLQGELQAREHELADDVWYLKMIQEEIAKRARSARELYERTLIKLKDIF